MSEESTAAHALRRAWSASSGGDRLARLTRESLMLSASEDPSLTQTLASLTADGRTELDLHLEGPAVAAHETAAFGFGRFVARTALAVKEVGKSITGLKQLGPHLQVLAPSPGSVRVVFRSPDRTHGTPIRGTETDTVEAMAMRRVVALMLQAENADGSDSPVGASLHGLRGDARRAVRLVAQAVVDAHWDVQGELRAGDGHATEIRLSNAGAARLAEAAKVTDAEVELGRVMEGEVDGWVWSEATMTFIPDTGRRFRASVGDESLHAAVAHAVDDPQRRVRATFTVVSTYPPGDTGSVRRSYELTAIRLLEPDPTLDLGPARQSPSSSSQDRQRT